MYLILKILGCIAGEKGSAEATLLGVEIASLFVQINHFQLLITNVGYYISTHMVLTKKYILLDSCWVWLSN